MAKRKRLTPARPGYLGSPVDGVRAPETKSMPISPRPGGAPISQVAGEASSQAALSELADALETARARGLMVMELPLASVDERYLVRDRLELNEEEMGALVESLRARGQQTPIEVTALARPVGGMTHGLISGWRRLSALNRLYKETKDIKFATVKALVIRPETAQDAYLAMVEENEIRVNLSFYERARIAVRALREGVYPTQRAVLQGLFANVPRAKRSKIGSFIVVVETLDAVLRYPSAISEKLGLSIARALSHDPGFADHLAADLRAGSRDSPEAEMRILAASVSVQQKAAKIAETETIEADPIGRGPVERHITQVAAGIRISFTPAQDRIELDGPGVTLAFMEDLRDWLRRR